MSQSKSLPLMAVYSCGHFLVDLTCAFLLLSLPISGDERLTGIILYNFCAFALQMPAGLIADRLNRNELVAALGMCLTCVSFLLYPLPLFCAIILGVGNCLYHIGGGVDVLGFSDKKQWMLGVFVSPGAVGLFVGTLLANAKAPVITVFIVIAALSVAVVLALHFTYSLCLPSGNPAVSVKPSGKAPAAAIFCLFAVVVLRSYVGMTLYTPWKNGILLSILSVLALALGKAAGGFLADKFGALKASVVSLALCSVLFVFADNAIIGILAIFLFNMTMPITLFGMASLFPGSKGFAFGILTFALFLGAVPTFLSLPLPFYGQTWFHAVEAAVSLILLTAGLLACKGEKNE